PMILRIASQADEGSFDGAHVAEVFDAEESPAYVNVEGENERGEERGRNARRNAFQYKRIKRMNPAYHRGAEPKLYLMQPSFWSYLWSLLRAASIGLYQDGCLGIAKGAAYSALLSFFPVLTTLAALLV